MSCASCEGRKQAVREHLHPFSAPKATPPAMMCVCVGLSFLFFFKKYSAPKLPFPFYHVFFLGDILVVQHVSLEAITLDFLDLLVVGFDRSFDALWLHLVLQILITVQLHMIFVLWLLNIIFETCKSRQL